MACTIDTNAIQVRATTIVKEAVLAGELPPHPFPTMELCGRPGRYPSRYELKLIFDFEHFVRYIESAISSHKPWENFSELPWANSPDLQLDRRWRFYSAMYRTLLAGAVLYRTYNEPLVQGETNGPPNFLGDWIEAWREDIDENFSQGFTNAEFEYLRSFPVYNLEAHSAEAEEQPYFQGLVELFVNESKIRLRDEGPIDGSYLPSLHKPKVDDLNPLQSILLHEAGQFAHAYETLISLSDFYISGDGLRPRVLHESIQDLIIYDSKLMKATMDERCKIVSLPIVRLGVFRLERVPVPLAIEEARDTPLALYPLNRNFPSFQHLDSFLKMFHEYSDRVNNYNPIYPTPYPPLDFVEYIFRTQLNLRFADKAFSMRGFDFPNPYETQIREPEGVFVEPWREDDVLEYASVRRKRLEDYSGDGVDE